MIIYNGPDVAKIFNADIKEKGTTLNEHSKNIRNPEIMMSTMAALELG